MKPVPSAPKAMIDRISAARQSIESDKRRAREQGREYQPVFGPLTFTDEAIQVFERLASHPEMERVWKVLSGIFDDAKRPPHTWAFADFCYETIGVWQHSPHRTAAEHTKHFKQIADDLRNVVHRIIVEPEFGKLGQSLARVSPLKMVGDEHLAWLLEEMNADPVDGNYVRSDEDAISYLRFSLNDVLPPLYDYAEWIAKEAERIAAQPSISDRPHHPSAQRTFFIRNLSAWFRDRFHRPMHEVVAGIASALFDEAVTGDTVRKAVLNEPELSPHIRRGKVPLPK